MKGMIVMNETRKGHMRLWNITNTDMCKWELNRTWQSRALEINYVRGACSVNRMVRVLKMYMEGLACLVRKQVWIKEWSGKTQDPKMM